MCQPNQSSNGTSNPVFDHVDPLNRSSKLPRAILLDYLRQPALDADETVKMFHLLGQCMTVAGYCKPQRPELLRELQEMIKRIANAAGTEPPENAAYLTSNDRRTGTRKRRTTNDPQPDIESDQESLIHAHEWRIPRAAQYHSPAPPPSQHLYRIQSSTFSHSINSRFVPPIANNKPQFIDHFQLQEYKNKIYGWF